MKMAETYTARDITVLEGLEPVRKRPGMYIGGVGSTGLHHLVWEILDNAVDEAMNGHAQNVQVTLHADRSSITVVDDGRGVPVDRHPRAVRALCRSSSPRSTPAGNSSTGRTARPAACTASAPAWSMRCRRSWLPNRSGRATCGSSASSGASRRRLCARSGRRAAPAPRCSSGRIRRSSEDHVRPGPDSAQARGRQLSPCRDPRRLRRRGAQGEAQLPPRQRLGGVPGPHRESARQAAGARGGLRGGEGPRRERRADQSGVAVDGVDRRAPPKLRERRTDRLRGHPRKRPARRDRQGGAELRRNSRPVAQGG